MSQPVLSLTYRHLLGGLVPVLGEHLALGRLQLLILPRHTPTQGRVFSGL